MIEQSNDFVQELPDYLDDLRRNPTLRQFDDDYGVIERAQDYVTQATSDNDCSAASSVSAGWCSARCSARSPC